MTNPDEQRIVNIDDTQPHATPALNLDTPEETARERLLWGARGAAGCLLILLVIVFGVALVTAGSINGALDRAQGAVRFIVDAPPPEASTVSSQTIVTSVQPLGQLVSTSAQFAKADITVNVTQARLNACGHSARHVVEGTIDAGIDLQNFDEGSVVYNETTDTYTVTLPPAQLTSCRIDFIDQYDRRFPAAVCGIDWDELRQIANYRAVVELREDALEAELLERAERDAQDVVGNFVRALTGSNVEVQFAEAADGVVPVPSSCEGEIPEGWRLDPATQTWTNPIP